MGEDAPRAGTELIVATLIREPEIWAAMRRRFPWVERERGEIGEGLIHLDFAALRRGLERAAQTQDSVDAGDILGFIEELVDRLDALHPDVMNALDISFLEDLYLGDADERDFVTRLLRPKTRARWQEIAEVHDRRSG